MREASNCRIGFCYTANDSNYVFEDALSLKLVGAEIITPNTKTPDFDLELQPGSDHIVLFRQIDPQCSFGISNQTVMRHRLPDEFVEEAKK